LGQGVEAGQGLGAGSGECLPGEQRARLADHLARVLAELPPKCRQAFVLNRIEGWTQAEVATCMGLSKNMIERYVMRAIQHVQERLREHNP
jgi:RNA polymerase sigma-70 factor (ECF subfamily)